MKNFLLLIVFVSAIQLSCNKMNDEKASYASLNDSTSVTGLTGDSVKLVKTASANFKVKDVEKSSRVVSGLAKKSGGMIFHQSLVSAESGRNELRISEDSLLIVTSFTPQANITARIPSENMEEFMYSVADLGYFTGSMQLDVDDKSLAYLENTLKQKNRTEVLSRPPVKKSASLTSLQRIGIKDETIEEQINNRAIDAEVNYSLINLRLFQNPVVKKETIVNYTISDYRLSFGKRLRNAIQDGWGYFLELVLVVANLWIIITLALVFFYFYRYLQQRKKIAVLKLK